MDRVRMIVAKVGLDGHDRGAKAVALAMRDIGFEVIYTGLRQTPERVVETALEEDADVIGVSLLSGAHLSIMKKIHDILIERGIRDETVLVLGGNVPLRDHDELRRHGVDKIFSTDSRFDEMGAWLQQAVQAKRKNGAGRDA